MAFLPGSDELGGAATESPIIIDVRPDRRGVGLASVVRGSLRPSELFEYSLFAAPAGLVFAIVATIKFGSGWPLLMAPFGGLVGGLLGRVAWEWFATKSVGFELGSEFEGYDWVAGFACAGVLVGAVLGSALAAKRAQRAPAR